MIDFLSDAYTTHEIVVNNGNDWRVNSHLRYYFDYWKTFNEVLKSKISISDNLIQNGDANSTSKYEKLKREVPDSFENIFKNIVEKNSNLQTHDNSRISVDSALLTRIGTFAKVVALMDKYGEGFIHSYALVNQVNPYDCLFKTVYKNLLALITDFKSGRVMNYYDWKFTNFRDNLNAYTKYISQFSGQDLIDNMGDAYMGDYDVDNEDDDGTTTYQGLYYAYSDYKTSITEGFIDLNKICETVDIYSEDLYVAVKALAAINITFYSPPEDENFLRQHATENFDYLTLDSGVTDGSQNDIGVDTTSVANQKIKIRTLQAISVAVPIALDTRKKMTKTMSNSSQLIYDTMNKVLTVILIKQHLENENNIILTQSINIF